MKSTWKRPSAARAATATRGAADGDATSSIRSRATCRNAYAVKQLGWCGFGLAALLVSACGSGSALPSAQTAHAANSTSTELVPVVPVEPTSQASGIFLLDGEPMCFLGANNYYLIYKPREMVDDVLDTAREMGVRVFRHWAFTDRGTLDGTVPSLDGDGTKQGVYFQYWDAAAKKPAYNDGPNGLERLDYLLYKARQNDIRIVLVLTNNWRDFGGMDQYLTWHGLSKHHEFYTDERVRRAYKDYVAHLINRVNKFTGVTYKDDPYIFAWGLANEPRMRNFEDYDSPADWKPGAVTAWAREMSDYIRSLDANHLISVGDEGFYSGRTGALYAGEDGVDHDALSALDNVDYTTFHLYPDHWGQSLGWGGQWIEDHLASARRIGKPAVLEEYNVAVRRDETTLRIVHGGPRRAEALVYWHDLARQRGASGAMFWMLAGYDHERRSYYKDYDHFSVYAPQVDETGRAMQTFGVQMRNRARACERSRTEPRLLEPRRQVPPGFVTTSKPEVVRQLNANANSVTADGSPKPQNPP